MKMPSAILINPERQERHFPRETKAVTSQKSDGVSIFRSQRQLYLVLAVLAGLLVFIASWMVTWAVHQDNQRYDNTRAGRMLESFIKSVLQQAEDQAGEVRIPRIIDHLSEAKRPERLDLFIFDGDHRNLFSSRAEISLGNVYGKWLVAEGTTLAEMVAATPPGGTKYFPGRLQSVGGWKSRNGLNGIFYIEGTSFYALAHLEPGAVAIDDPYIMPLRLGAVLGVAASLLFWGLTEFHHRRQLSLWSKNLLAGRTAIKNAVEKRQGVVSEVVMCSEMAAFLSRLEFLREEMEQIARKEHRLGVAENSARAVLNSVNDAVFVVGNNGVINWANRRVEEMFDCARSGLHLTPLSLLCGEPGLEQLLLDEIGRAWEDDPRSFQWVGRRVKTGEVFPVEARACRVPLTTSDAVCVSLRDVSKQQSDEAALRQALGDLHGVIERANTASRAKDEFVAKVSHEIRTPMNAILGLSHLAKRDWHDPRKRDS